MNSEFYTSKMNVSEKKIEELTVEEWGTLFPIKMVPYQSEWVTIFSTEKLIIEKKLGKDIALDIEHIGSTSIPNLSSKGYIDILIDIPEERLFDETVIKDMQSLGYEYCMQDGYGPIYMIFAKGFCRDGKNSQKFFVHMTPKTHSQIWDRIYFRDYLRKNEKIAREYEDLKLRLASRFSKDKRSFQKGKTDFVIKVTELAKQNNSEFRIQNSELNK
ncbi:GrpB family protein [Aquimarina sp. ERC-38]|uniref:GrpB family protein n=1 Tax=Aquimarina sp. ERC-38 TaxID=2949996 RepID=UPI0022455C45|nr:GrpB family protein [Aquimarina sp. ERC-38]UZO79278.1 GrpB family protein [Aquimarina sp. ERC-38]